MSDSRGFYRGKLPDPSTKEFAEGAERLLADIFPKPTTREQARAQGFTGDVCSQCGGAHMQVAGHCMVCADCGTTTGCS